jgi:hypothetical protein
MKKQIMNRIEAEHRRLKALGYKVVLSDKNHKRPLGMSWHESLNMRCNGTKHNIGLDCTDSIIAIDIDKTSNDDNMCKILYNAMKNTFPELTTTSTTLTPSGGFHFYLKATCKIMSVNNTAGWTYTFNGNTYRVPIDIKADGGFVVLAPSHYPGGGSPKHAWKDQYKGVPYHAIIPIGDDTQEPSPKLLEFITRRQHFTIVADDVEIDENGKSGTRTVYRIEQV